MKKRPLKGLQRKMDNTLNDFKEVLQETIDTELDNMETFSPEMVKHIQEVYRNLREQRRLWLEEKNKNAEEQS